MRHKVITIIAAISIFYPALAGALVCVYDSNSNGVLDSGESAQCIATQSGELCPFQLTDCSASYSDPVCPQNMTYNPTTKKCESQLSCPAGYTYDPKNGTCTGSPVYSCPSGMNYNATTGLCEAQPVLTPVVIFNETGGETRTCDANCQLARRTLASVTLSAGESIDIEYKTFDIGCGGLNTDLYEFRIMNRTTELAKWNNGNSAWICPMNCARPEVNEACGTPSNRTYTHSYTASQNIAVSVDFAMNLYCQYNNCTYNVTVSHKRRSCPSGSSYNASTGLCQSQPSMQCPPGGTYDSVRQVCIVNASCPQGSVYDQQRSLCLADPSCTTGTFDGTSGKCLTGYSCPHGTQYPCLLNSGKYQCSPNTCIDPATAGESTDTTMGSNDIQDNGWSSDGNCLGKLYIFNGNDLRCRPPGTQTGFSDCCKKDSTWFGMGQCETFERTLAKLRTTYRNEDYTEADANCHYIGEYCAERWKLGFTSVCVQKKKTFCCFGSPLARIIQQQGRAQLGIPWGTPQSPNCRGLTIEEFQKIDFSRIDFSEWINQIVEPQIQSGIGNAINNAVQNLQQNLQNLAQ